MGLLGRKSTDAERAEELFSPYLDGQVTQEEGLFLERYLAEHVEAREKFNLLKSAVQMTRSLPAVKAPRSFVLPRSMARKSSLALRLYPVMRFATVAAVALFAFALAGDFSRQSAPAAQPQANALVLGAQATDTLALGSVEPLQLEAAAEATAAPVEEPPAFAAEPVPTATPQGTPAAARLSTETETDATTDSAQEEAAPPADATSVTEAPAPEPQASEADSSDRSAAEIPVREGLMLDALRLAVIGFGLLVVVLGAATLLLRRQL
jgi:hypothetical protein